MSVDFEPVKLGPRRRRLDPLTAGVVVVAVALAAAVVKPWETSGSGGAPGPSAIAAVPTSAASPSARPTPTARVDRIVSATGLPEPTWAEVAPVLEPHDALGIRAIMLARRPNVGLPASPRFQERWSPATLDPGGGGDSAYVNRDDQSIVALGITFPLDARPMDARIWLVHTDDRLEWIDARPLEPNHLAGAFTFTRFDAAAGRSVAWPGGHYRIDVLAEDGVHQIAVQVPGRFGSVPAPAEWPPTETGLVDPDRSNPSSVRIGPFATVDGVGVPLASQGSPLLTDEEAWRDVLVEGSGGPRSDVATAYLPRATGLGVMLTGHAEVRLAIVRRIAPDARFLAQPMLGGISETQGRTPYVTFAPRGGGAWPPGVYAITVRWTDPAGLHVETWHIELRPGPARTPFAAR